MDLSTAPGSSRHPPARHPPPPQCPREGPPHPRPRRPRPACRRGSCRRGRRPAARSAKVCGQLGGRWLVRGAGSPAHTTTLCQLQPSRAAAPCCLGGADHAAAQTSAATQARHPQRSPALQPRSPTRSAAVPCNPCPRPQRTLSSRLASSSSLPSARSSLAALRAAARRSPSDAQYAFSAALLADLHTWLWMGRQAGMLGQCWVARRTGAPTRSIASQGVPSRQPCARSQKRPSRLSIPPAPHTSQQAWPAAQASRPAAQPAQPPHRFCRVYSSSGKYLGTSVMVMVHLDRLPSPDPDAAASATCGPTMGGRRASVGGAGVRL